MPPKPSGGNMHPRAREKQEKEAAKAHATNLSKLQAVEDAKWAGEGPSRQELRQAEKMKKAQEQQEKKQMKKLVNEEDSAMMSSVKLSKSAKSNLRELGEYKGGQKVTQFELQQRKEREEKERLEQLAIETRKQEKILEADHLAFENTNRERRDQRLADEAKYGAGNSISAGDVESAIKGMSLLSVSGSDIKSDKWPEKRRKQAYKAFEERRLKELRLDYPDFKLSQLKEKCFKEFQTSPENPMNQP